MTRQVKKNAAPQCCASWINGDCLTRTGLRLNAAQRATSPGGMDGLTTMQIQVQSRELIDTLARLKREGRTCYGMKCERGGGYTLSVSEPRQADFADFGISRSHDEKNRATFAHGAIS